MMNHSCVTTIINQFQGSRLIVRATRALQPGNEVGFYKSSCFVDFPGFVKTNVFNILIWLRKEFMVLMHISVLGIIPFKLYSYILVLNCYNFF